MSNKSGLSDKLVTGKLGNIYTKRFLASKNVRMVSEGDFLARVRCLCRVTFSLPFQAIWIFFFIYARIIVQKSTATNMIVPEDQLWLIKQQIVVLNFFITVQLYHILLFSSVIIVMLNMTMGKGVTIFTSIFNVLFIAEALLFASFIFVLDWVGILQNFKSISYFLEVIRTQWLWIIMIIAAMRSFWPVRKVWREINAWNREWIRIDRYRRTEDKENAFIFKTWVTPGEIKARIGMISAGWLAIFLASAFELLDVFFNAGFEVMKYTILIFGYVIFLAAFIVPYSRMSLIFYWVNQTFLLGLVIYACVMAQDYAWQPGNHFYYLYLIILLPWMICLRAAIRYTWTIKDREEIKAVVLNMFENQDEFEQYLDQKAEQQAVVASEATI